MNRIWRHLHFAIFYCYQYIPLFFMEETKKYLGQVLVMCEAANAEGIELTEEELATVNGTLTSIRAAAESESKSFEEFIEERYGTGITESDISSYLKLTTLANKYYSTVYDGFKYTDEDYEKYFEENKTSYQYADFLKYNFVFPTSTESSDTKANEEAEQKAKAYAEDLAKCKSEKEFKEYVRRYLTANPGIITASSETSMSDDEVKSAINEAVEGTVMKKYPYEVTSDGGKWLFDPARKELDSTVIKNTNSYTSLVLLKPAYRDESTSRSVRHILFTPQSYGGESQSIKVTLEKTKEVYQGWLDNDPTEESFAELAKQYSDDGGSKENGGLYENVKEGDMVPTFNEWLFDSERKPGDSGIVKTEFGFHIMYYIGEDDTPAWKKSMDTLMRTDSFNEHFEEIAEKYTVEFNESAISSIEESEYQESSTITYDEGTSAASQG